MAARRDGAGLETLIGRYGTLALATLTILMGVGAFVSWAIANARLGPELRVGLGVALAAATAALGGWLRRRGTVRFGNVLLGLALAIVHVDAWGAGPNLQLVPPAAALAVAAVASAALALLAWRADEETLFAVGAGGALLAPFVTGGGNGLASVLLTYGWVVSAAAMAALRGRRWSVARRLLTFAVVVYVAAGAAAAGGGPLLERLAPTTFALAIAWTALAVAGRPQRRGIARVALLAALTALLGAGFDAGRPPVEWWMTALFAAAIALSACAASVDTNVEMGVDTDAGTDAGTIDYLPLDAVVLPLAALAVALAALPHVVGARGAALALAWSATAAAMVASRPPSGERRNAFALTAGLAAVVAIVLAAHPQSPAAIVALSLFAVVLGPIQRRFAIASLAAPATVALVLASAWAFIRLTERPPFAYTPFLTPASALALVAVAGWWAYGRLAAAPGARHALRVAPAAVCAFWWGRTELAHTGSVELATFLLTLYYALVGVVAILIGRWRSVATARHAGLALAIYAALRALARASDLQQIHLRIGSYLLVGAFLLGVAYWYRTAGDTDATAPLPNE